MAKAAWLTMVLVGAAAGCSSSGGDTAVPEATPVVQPGPTAPGPSAGTGTPAPPDLNLDAGATPTPTSNPVRTVWAVDKQNQLVRFEVRDPSKVEKKPITGLQKNERLLGIDFRPATGMLYGLGSSSRVYVIDRATGAAKSLTTDAFSPPLSGQSFGFDFNPVVDRIRVHSDVDQNLRLHPMTGGTAAVDAALSFTTGDVNEGQNPNIAATAYTNSISPAPMATTLYAIDTTRNILVKVPDANAGKLATVGALGVDVVSTAGFDIWGGGTQKLEAYAALTVGSELALYAIDLEKGSAKKIGPIADDADLDGIAIEP